VSWNGIDLRLRALLVHGWSLTKSLRFSHASIKAVGLSNIVHREIGQFIVSRQVLSVLRAGAWDFRDSNLHTHYIAARTVYQFRYVFFSAVSHVSFADKCVATARALRHAPH
jgi:hypothetical protein